MVSGRFGRLFSLGFLFTFFCCAGYCRAEDVGRFYASWGWGESVADFGVGHLKIRGMFGDVMGARKGEHDVVGYSYDTFAKGVGGVEAGGFGDKYRPRYSGKFGFSGSFGYRFRSFEIGVQATEREFQLNTAGYKIQDNALHFAFVRSKGGVGRSGEEVEGFVAENAGVRVGSVVFDVCYSGLRFNEKGKVYSCLGLGLGAVDHVGTRGKLRALWGARMGAELEMGENLAVFGEVYYQGLGSVPGRVRVFSALMLDGVDTMLTSEVDVSYVGNMCGLRYLF